MDTGAARERLARALDRLIEALRRWSEESFGHRWPERDDWHHEDHVRLLQMRSEFHGAVQPLYQAHHNQELPGECVNLLAAINDLTWVDHTEPWPAEADEDFEESEIRHEAPPAFDAFIDWFADEDNVIHHDLQGPDEWPAVCDNIREIVGRVTGQFVELRGQAQPDRELANPIAVAEVVRRVGKAAGRSDHLADKLRRRGCHVVLLAGKWHCELDDAVQMFPLFRDRLAK